MYNTSDLRNVCIERKYDKAIYRNGFQMQMKFRPLRFIIVAPLQA